MNNIKIEAVDHHRNGVGGMPFHVVLFTCPEGGRMLAIVMDDASRDDYSVAVLNRDKLAAGDIAFGSNSYRGDYYAYALWRAVDDFEANREASC